MVTSGKARWCPVQVDKNRTEATFRSIPDNRSSHCAWDCEREAWSLAGVRSDDSQSAPGLVACPPPGSGERTVAGEPVNPPPRGSGLLTTRTRTAAASGAHRDRNPCFLALANVGLIGTLHL